MQFGIFTKKCGLSISSFVALCNFFHCTKIYRSTIIINSSALEANVHFKYCLVCESFSFFLLDFSSSEKTNSRCDRGAVRCGSAFRKDDSVICAFVLFFNNRARAGQAPVGLCVLSQGALSWSPVRQKKKKKSLEGLKPPPSSSFRISLWSDIHPFCCGVFLESRHLLGPVMTPAGQRPLRGLDAHTQKSWGAGG